MRLAVTVVDASMVVVLPLLVKHLVDNGIIAGDRGVVTWVALAGAATLSRSTAASARPCRVSARRNPRRRPVLGKVGPPSTCASRR